MFGGCGSCKSRLRLSLSIFAPIWNAPPNIVLHPIGGNERRSRTIGRIPDKIAGLVFDLRGINLKEPPFMNFNQQKPVAHLQQQRISLPTRLINAPIFYSRTIHAQQSIINRLPQNSLALSGRAVRQRRKRWHSAASNNNRDAVAKCCVDAAHCLACQPRAAS